LNNVAVHAVEIIYQSINGNNIGLTSDRVINNSRPIDRRLLYTEVERVGLAL